MSLREQAGGQLTASPGRGGNLQKFPIYLKNCGATVAFAGSMAITAAGDLAPALLGQKINWGKFAFDMALGVVRKKLGPADAMEKAILGKLGTTAIEKVVEKAAKEALAKVLAVSGEALMKKSLETTQKRLSGKDVTWDEFGEETKKDLYKQTAVEVVKLLLKG